MQSTTMVTLYDLQGEKAIRYFFVIIVLSISVKALCLLKTIFSFCPEKVRFGMPPVSLAIYLCTENHPWLLPLLYSLLPRPIRKSLTKFHLIPVISVSSESTPIQLCRFLSGPLWFPNACFQTFFTLGPGRFKIYCIKSLLRWKVHQWLTSTLRIKYRHLASAKKTLYN